MNSWKKCILNFNSSIRDAIINLEKSKIQIVLAVNNKNIFVGTLTDGDIRRAILEGIDLESPI